MKWKVITNSAPQLSDDLVTEDFNFFDKFLYGVEIQEPRWRRVLDKTSNHLGEAIGQLYVEKYFPAEAKARVTNLVENLRIALGERIKKTAGIGNTPLENCPNIASHWPDTCSSIGSSGLQNADNQT